MANETPKKPIRRTTVPTVPKDTPKLPAVESESKAKQNFLLFILFLVMSAIVYVAIFQKSFLSRYVFTSQKKPVIAVTDTTSIQSDTLEEEEEDDELNTFIGQDKPAKKKNKKVYPAGSKHYLVAGTFIFYPYAEKCRDRMKAEGYEADIITTGENLKFHRVYIQSSTDGAAIRTKRDELHRAGRTEMWVYVE